MQQDTPRGTSPDIEHDDSPAAALAALLPAGRGPGPEPAMLADRPDGAVVRLGDRVAKAHAPDSDTASLAVRLRIAADPALDGVLLPPLRPAPSGRLRDGRTVTAWPYGLPVAPDAPEAAPWEAAGALLARLHAVPLRELQHCHGPLPAMRGPAKAVAAMARLREAEPSGPGAGLAQARLAAARSTVEAAWSRLPAWCRGEAEAPVTRPRALCHGDFHLGQLVRHPVPLGSWQLIDVDDIGIGDPAWDLARPAAWYACGLLPPPDWEQLLAGYLRGGGPPANDLWPWLDGPARTLTVQTAALTVAKAAPHGRLLDEDEEALLAACSRIVELPGPAGP